MIKSKLIFVVALLFVNEIALFAQWQQGTGDLNEGAACSISFANKMYFGGSSVNISRDSGKSFVRMQLVNKTVLVRDIAFHDSVMFAVSDGLTPGMYLSHDSGYTYVRSDLLRRRLSAMSYDAGILYLLESHKLWLSSNEGKTITESKDVSGDSRPLQMAVKNHELYVAYEDSLMLRSLDNGSTWQALEDQRTRKVRDIIYDGSVLMVSTRTGLLISFDKGNTFVKRFPDSDTGDVPAICFTDGKMYVADAYGSLFVSSTNGLNWKAIANRLDSSAMNGIIAGPGNIVAVNSKGHVWYRPLEQVLSEVSSDECRSHALSSCGLSLTISKNQDRVLGTCANALQSGCTVSLYSAAEQRLINRLLLNSMDSNQVGFEFDLQSLCNGVYMVVYQSGSEYCSHLVSICR